MAPGIISDFVGRLTKVDNRFLHNNVIEEAWNFYNDQQIIDDLKLPLFKKEQFQREVYRMISNNKRATVSKKNIPFSTGEAMSLPDRFSDLRGSLQGSGWILTLSEQDRVLLQPLANTGKNGFSKVGNDGNTGVRFKPVSMAKSFQGLLSNDSASRAGIKRSANELMERPGFLLDQSFLSFVNLASGSKKGERKVKQVDLECSVLRTDGDEAKIQNPHRDLTEVECAAGECYIAFAPLTDDGMYLKIWDKLPNNDDGTYSGTVYFIRFGYLLLLPGDAVHAGGYRDDVTKAHARLHMYVYCNSPSHMGNKANVWLPPEIYM